MAWLDSKKKKVLSSVMKVMDGMGGLLAPPGFIPPRRTNPENPKWINPPIQPQPIIPPGSKPPIDFTRPQPQPKPRPGPWLGPRPQPRPRPQPGPWLQPQPGPWQKPQPIAPTPTLPVDIKKKDKIVGYFGGIPIGGVSSDNPYADRLKNDDLMAAINFSGTPAGGIAAKYGHQQGWQSLLTPEERQQVIWMQEIEKNHPKNFQYRPPEQPQPKKLDNFLETTKQTQPETQTYFPQSSTTPSPTVGNNVSAPSYQGQPLGGQPLASAGILPSSPRPQNFNSVRPLIGQILQNRRGRRR